MATNTKLREQYNLLSANTAEYFECQLSVIDETAKAICFDACNGYLASSQRLVWLPKSQMVILDFGSDGGKRYFVKNWLYGKVK